MRVLVVGGGVSGEAAARLAIADGDDVVIYDDDPAVATRLQSVAPVVSRDNYDSVLDGLSLAIVSPGVPLTLDVIESVQSRGTPTISEIEFALRHTQRPYCAVTGTNGKTTVAAAATDMLQASGVSALAVGNIGVPLSAAVTDSESAVFVVEMSSFQLNLSDTFHPKAGAITNIAEDHLDVHGSFEAYADAKAKIFANQQANDMLTWDADDPGASAVVGRARAVGVPVSGRQLPWGGNGVDGDELVVADMRFEAPPVGQAYIVDLLIAATLAEFMGANENGIAATIAAFEPGEHRREVVAVIDGVVWVDDSKATNPHAALASIRAYDRVVLIAGGRNKGLVLSRLPNEPNVKRTIAIGESAPELLAAAPTGMAVQANSLSQAVSIASDFARSGDTVLLAPGCASFDMFTSYIERGDVFRDLVTALRQGT